MAYSNVAVSTAKDVLTQCATFAASTGWTVLRNAARSSDPNDWIITISPTGGTPYLTLLAWENGGDEDYIYINCHRGLDTGADWDDQPDQFNIPGGSSSDGSKVKLKTYVDPMKSVFFFGDSNYLYMAIEKDVGYYAHVLLGNIDKFGTSLGGMFLNIVSLSIENHATQEAGLGLPFAPSKNVFSTHMPSGGLDSQNIAGTAKWYAVGPTNDTIITYDRVFSSTCEMTSSIRSAPNPFNSRTPLTPITLFVSTDGVIVPVGTLPNIRLVNLDYYEATEEITIGGDVWKVFPMVRKGDFLELGSHPDYDVPENHFSGNYGLAYLK